MFYVVSFPRSPDPDRCTILNDEEFSLCVGDMTVYYKDSDYNACMNFMNKRNDS